MMDLGHASGHIGCTALALVKSKMLANLLW